MSRWRQGKILSVGFSRSSQSSCSNAFACLVLAFISHSLAHGCCRQKLREIKKMLLFSHFCILLVVLKAAPEPPHPPCPYLLCSSTTLCEVGKEGLCLLRNKRNCCLGTRELIRQDHSSSGTQICTISLLRQSFLDVPHLSLCFYFKFCGHGDHSLHTSTAFVSP